MELSSFSYRTGNSLLHRTPAGIKLLILLVFSLVLFFLPQEFFAASVLLLCLLFLLSPSKTDMLRDLKPLVFYGVFLCLVSGFSLTGGFGFEARLILHVLPFLLRIIAIGAAASLMYRTTSPLQMRETLENAEIRVRSFLRLKNRRAQITTLFSLYLMFFPRVFENWQNIERAWKARGGKNGPKKLVALIPVLFALSLRNAYETALALQNRQAD